MTHSFRIRQSIRALSMLFSLTGCLGLPLGLNEDIVDLSIDKNDQLLLNKKPIISYLYPADYLCLDKFIRTAQPQETIQWRRYATTYTLMSQEIFLNEQARPCRRYQLKATSFLPLVKTIYCTETSCRGIKGQWEKLSES